MYVGTDEPETAKTECSLSLPCSVANRGSDISVLRLAIETKTIFESPVRGREEEMEETYEELVLRFEAEHRASAACWSLFGTDRSMAETPYCEVAHWPGMSVREIELTFPAGDVKIVGWYSPATGMYRIPMSQNDAPTGFTWGRHIKGPRAALAVR